MAGKSRAKQIGLALGSGSARGWAHIGVIRVLAEMGIEPDIICGSSIGALVGAYQAMGRLDDLESFALGLTGFDVVKFMDFKIAARGGFLEGKRLTDYFRNTIGDAQIEDLPKVFAAAATSTTTGREIWFREGSVLEAVRASISLPGIFTPVRYNNDWLVDGGLVNPVPVSICRALGADIVIAVNLNGDLLGRHVGPQAPLLERDGQNDENDTDEAAGLMDRAANYFSQLFEPDDRPGVMEVLANSINIMQDRITRSRMAGDPPEILLAPRLAHLDLLEFDRAEEAIEEGRRAVERSKAGIEDYLRS